MEESRAPQTPPPPKVPNKRVLERYMKAVIAHMNNVRRGDYSSDAACDMAARVALESAMKTPTPETWGVAEAALHAMFSEINAPSCEKQ